MQGSEDFPEKGQVIETRLRTPGPPEVPVNPASQPPSDLHPSSFRVQPNSFHTPASKIKAAVSSAFRTASNVEDRRNIIVNLDIPKMIPEIPLQDYVDYIMPPLPDSLKGNVDNVLKILESDGTIDVSNDRWSAFPVDPAHASAHESVVFQGLTAIFNAVVASAKRIDSSLNQTFGLIVNGNVPMYSDRGASSRPDAFNKLFKRIQEPQATLPRCKEPAEQGQKPKNQQHHVYDLANPQQFKLRDGQNDADDDFAKLIYDMEQVLARDPCRRFTFGTTIENRTTRLWFLSRASLLRTTAFDFIKDRHKLVHFFLSIAFSSLTDMGWDSTMTLCQVDDFGRRQYNIEVNGQLYTTVEVLSDSSADSPLGRATRVWQVKGSDGGIRVLKDVWLESDRLEEHKIWEAILADAKALNGNEEDNHHEELEKRMLKPMAYCRVCVDNQADDTGTVMLSGYDLSSAPLVDLITPKAPSAEAQSVAMSMPADKDSTIHSTNAIPDGLDQKYEHSHRTQRENLAQRRVVEHYHHHRYHYRIVFEQCATTIYDERSLDNVFRALVEVVKALYVLHLAGWVHRDISGGNIYWFADGQMGLLGDFEYATRLTDRRRHNVRTGTPFFMAAETIGNGYLFTSAKLNLEKKSRAKIDFNLTRKNTVTKITVPAVGSTLPFSYNPLHDLESIWWIIVYVLYFNDDQCSPSQDSMCRQNKMNELFHGRLDVTNRLLFLRDSGRLPDAKKYLSPSFTPALKLLVQLAELLTSAYERSEKSYPMKIDDQYFIIHDDFLEPLLSEEYVGPLSTITLVHVKESSKKRTNTTPPEMERATKRSRTSATNDLNGANSRQRKRNGRSTKKRSSLRKS
ncbi:hypothetical protein F5050DRAFT_1822131 [Lentinula boryana]|uniref:Fungal-type protein kinase domain-containing protein n=1 Tax=Lentinula boryana TaxID=40481 RepID=A0ABQ8QBU7_9AGAR|nr:hypothetical protein F5050DRAFT_1822131 [Lentinula boryana]